MLISLRECVRELDLTNLQGYLKILKFKYFLIELLQQFLKVKTFYER